MPRYIAIRTLDERATVGSIAANAEILKNEIPSLLPSYEPRNIVAVVAGDAFAGAFESRSPISDQERQILKQKHNFADFREVAVCELSKDFKNTYNDDSQIRFVNSGKHGFRGDAVRIAILDTGLKFSHPNFTKMITCGMGRDFTRPLDEKGQPPVVVDDDHHHGTHVASILFAHSPNSIYYIYKVADKNGFVEEDKVALAINAAVEAGVHVINLSLGFRLFPPGAGISIVGKACAAAAQQGVVVVAASGNDAPHQVNKWAFAPAHEECVLAVGACDDNTSDMCSFSSYWPDQFVGGPAKPDIVAPGFQVLAAVPDPREEKKRLSGTSMATPAVAAGAAVLWQAHSVGSLSADKRVLYVKKRLVGTAHRLQAEYLHRQSSRQGAGCLNVDDAVAPPGAVAEAPIQVPRSVDPKWWMAAAGVAVCAFGYFALRKLFS